MPRRLTKRQLRERQRKAREHAQKRRPTPTTLWGLKTGPQTDKGPPPLKNPAWANTTDHIPSGGDRIKPSYDNHAPKYDGALGRREVAAKQHADNLKKQVAPLFNKGSYQLITPGTNPADIGKKG